MPLTNTNKLFSLGTTFIIVVVLVLSITMGFAIYVNDVNQHQIYKDQIRTKGETLVKFTALISSDAVLGHDYLLLNQYIKELSHQEDVVYGVIYASDSKHLTAYLNNENQIVEQYKAEDFIQTIKNINNDPDIIILQHAIDAGGKIGTVKLGVSMKRAKTLSQIAMRDQILQGLTIIILLSLMIYLIFRFRTLNPIEELIQSTRHVMNGNLTHKASIPNSRELAELATSFNQMTQVLASSNIEKDRAMDLIKQANEDLQTATRAKSSFLANMSHEIRTPLTAIIGFGETILDANTTQSERQDATQAIIRNGNHLQGIINDILDLSKIEAEKLEVEFIEVPLFELLHDIESLIEVQAQEKGIQVGINYRFPIPETIHTDPVRLKQILINLCNNAIKFTDKGSVRLEVGYDNLNHMMQFEVVDTGIGLTPEQQGKIFDSFTQADTSTTRKFGGTGLGLPLSRQLAEMLGGEISVSSKLGIGSRFTVTIAANPATDAVLVHELPGVSKAHKTPEQTEAINLNGSILLAEDVVDNQKLISLYIRHIGAQVTIANNGKEAVEIALNNHFDLILMDMQMPVMDGIEAVQTLRAQNYTGLIIALTANAMKEDKERCINAGCDDFLTKPIDRRKFNEMLGQYLNSESEQNKDIDIILPDIEETPEFLEIVELFIRSLPATQNNLRDALEKQDWETLQRVLHGLKSTGGGLGYLVITETCQDIELLVKNNLLNTAPLHTRGNDTQETINMLSKKFDRLHFLCERIIKGWNEKYSQSDKAKVIPLNAADQN